ncbi:hypothetical protein [Pararhizobium sp. A13]
MDPIKTGEAYWRDEDDVLWLAESWENSATGEVWTTQTAIPSDL